MNKIDTSTRIYLFIRGYILEHGYAPTNREMGEGVGLTSTSSVNRHLNKLLDKGFLETDITVNGNMCPRAYRLGKNPLGGDKWKSMSTV